MLDWAASNEEGKPKAGDKQTILNWVVDAYNYTKDRPQLVQKSFQVTGISTALDGSEDELIRDDALVETTDEEEDGKMQVMTRPTRIYFIISWEILMTKNSKDLNFE